MAQNPGSYTKLDDLISIAQNLVGAGVPKQIPGKTLVDTEDEANAVSDPMSAAERRVTLMAVEAALREDDFETAYSYIVSRLTPSGAEITAPASDVKGHTRANSKSSIRSQAKIADDSSWRAAFLAGRYRSSAASPPTLRRLEQRTELLSLALLLAPTSALTEILAAWRRCEVETTALQLSQQEAEEELDDHADSRSALPGNFVVGGEQPEMIRNQKRREMGRMGTGKGQDEAPVSMFDLTRSAARAFRRTAAPSQGAGGAPVTASPRSSLHESRTDDSVDNLGSDSHWDAQQRVRKRDMVASAVSGGLASGLGWVLGATPVKAQHEEQ